jgi:hypothetical protein
MPQKLISIKVQFEHFYGSNATLCGSTACLALSGQAIGTLATALDIRAA